MVETNETYFRELCLQTILREGRRTSFISAWKAPTPDRTNPATFPPDFLLSLDFSLAVFEFPDSSRLTGFPEKKWQLW